MKSNILKPRCVLCHLPLNPQEHYFCHSCIKFFAPQKLCERYGLPSETHICKNCYYHPSVWQRLFCVSDYYFSMKVLIRNFKYKNQTWLLKPLISLLSSQITEKPEVLLPVPMHRKRQLKRGYNQSNLLARELGKYIDVNVDYSVIVRSKLTHPQQGLTARQRQKNLQNAFRIRLPIFYRYVALVDDVVTTGTTVTQISQLLYENGVKRVDIICLCRTNY